MTMATDNLQQRYLDFRSRDPDDVAFQEQLDLAAKKDSAVQIETTRVQAEEKAQKIGIEDEGFEFEGSEFLASSRARSGLKDYVPIPSAFNEDAAPGWKAAIDWYGKLPQNVVKGGWRAIINTEKALLGPMGWSKASAAVAEMVPGLTESVNEFYNRMGGQERSDVITQDVAEFALPFMGYMRALSLAPKAQGAFMRLAQAGSHGLGADVITSATALDAHAGRFASILQQLDSPAAVSSFIDWMADTEDETDAEGRFKNALEAAALGPIIGSTMFFLGQGVRAAAHGMRTVAQARRKAGLVDPVKNYKLDPKAEGFGIHPREVLPKNDPLLRETHQEGAPLFQDPSRAQMQQDIVEKFVQAGASVQGRRPIAYVMGGGGASGKGTVLKALEMDGVIPQKGVVHIDPDLVKTGVVDKETKEVLIPGIPEYKQISDLGDYRAAPTVHEESSAIAKEIERRALEIHSDVVIDKTLGDKEKAIKMIDKLADEGYEIHLIGVTNNVDEALGRSIKRFTDTGRFVMTGELLKAHKGFAEGYSAYSMRVHSAQLYDNQGTKPVLIHSREGGEDVVHVPDWYDRFKRKKDINPEAQTLLEVQRGRKPRVRRASQGKP